MGCSNPVFEPISMITNSGAQSCLSKSDNKPKPCQAFVGAVSSDGWRQIPCDISITAGPWTSSHLGLLTQSPSYRQISLSNCETDLVHIMTACNQELNRALLSPDMQVSGDLFPTMHEPSCAKRKSRVAPTASFPQSSPC